MTTRIGTIGVYGWTAERFGEALREFGADALVDVRRRRGVRGHEYAWANAGRLQELCAEAGIAYEHCLELAPTEEIRDILREDDRVAKRARRARSELTPAFVEAYSALLDEPGVMAAAQAVVAPYDAPVLLCVEAQAVACHRSLAAARLSSDLGVPQVDL